MQHLKPLWAYLANPFLGLWWSLPWLIRRQRNCFDTREPAISVNSHQLYRDYSANEPKFIGNVVSIDKSILGSSIVWLNTGNEFEHASKNRPMQPIDLECSIWCINFFRMVAIWLLEHPSRRLGQSSSLLCG